MVAVAAHLHHDAIVRCPGSSLPVDVHVGTGEAGNSGTAAGRLAVNRHVLDTCGVAGIDGAIARRSSSLAHDRLMDEQHPSEIEKREEKGYKKAQRESGLDDGISSPALCV